MPPEVQIALISALSAILVPLVTAGTAVMVATFRKRGLEIEILKEKREDKLLGDAATVLTAKAQIANDDSQQLNLTREDLKTMLEEIVGAEAPRRKMPTPSVQKMEAVLATVEASSPVTFSNAPGPLPPPPPVPTDVRVTNRPPKRQES